MFAIIAAPFQRQTQDMWFRNLLIYRINQPLATDPEQLQPQLEERSFAPCSGLDTHRIGWESPLGPQAPELLHVTNGRLMVCLRREDRLLPPAVVREAVEEKAQEIEARENRPVGRKERTKIRDEVVVDLLPRAFTRSQRLYAYIDPAEGLIVIDTATSGRAEELLNLLRETLGSLKVAPLKVNNAPALTMTRWLEGDLPAELTLEDECELREPVENGAIIRARKLDLDGPELKQHLDAGLLASRVAVEWDERLRCVLGDDLAVRRLRFTDIVMEEAADTHAEDAAARLDADFALMSAELARFIPWMIEAFGGEETG